VNLTYSERELEHAFNLSKPSIIFSSPHACDKVVPVAKRLSFVKNVVLFGDDNPFEGDPFVIMLDDYIKDMQDNQTDFKAEPIDVDNHIAVILNSSGTTGLPKGVALTHANIMSSITFVQETVLKLSPIPRSERFILGKICKYFKKQPINFLFFNIRNNPMVSRFRIPDNICNLHHRRSDPGWSAQVRRGLILELH
jgi:acyl-CoA synthetase (AMP-forming)/AMP-acid ligase II